MSHTRGYNLKSGTRFCPIHGTRYDWDMLVCPRCTADAIEAEEAEWEPKRNYIDKAQAALPDVARMAEEIGNRYRNYRNMTDQQFAQLNEQEDANRAAIDDDAKMYG